MEKRQKMQKTSPDILLSAAVLYICSVNFSYSIFLLCTILMNSASILSIATKEGNEALLRRINTLTPVSKAEWGRMNVAQMLTHCQRPLKLSLAKKMPKRNILSYLVGGFLKRRILGDAGFSRNMPTAPELVVNDDRSFDVEREQLLSLVKRFAEGGLAAFPTDPHPLFGAMTPQEWDLFHAKHLDHHLRQFGA